MSTGDAAVAERLRDAPREVRAALAVTAAIFVGNGAAQFAWTARLPEIQERIGVDLGVLGALLLFGALGGVVGSPVAGRFADRLGSATASVAGGAFFVLSIGAIGLARSPVAFALAIAVSGFGDALADVSMNAQAGVVQDRLSRSVFGRLHGMWSLGALLGALVGAQTAALHLPLPQFLLGTGVVLAAAALTGRRFLLPDPPPVTVAHVPPPPVPSPQAVVPAVPTSGTAPAAIGPSTLALSAVLAALGLVVSLMETPAVWGALLVTGERGGSVALGGLALAAFSALQFAGRFGGDALVDRFGAVVVVRGSIVAQAVGLLLVQVDRGPWWAVGGYAFLGLGAAVAFPLLYRAAGATPGIARGAGIGIMNVGSRLGFLLAPPLIGAIGERVGLDRGLLAVLGCGLLLLVWQSRRFGVAPRAGAVSRG